MSSWLLSGVFHILKAMRYSLDGIRTCFHEEIAFRQECMIAVPHFVMLVLLHLPLSLKLYLVIMWFALVASELLNTAIEHAVNVASPQWSEGAKKAKDCASAAVFVVAVALVVGWLVAIFKLWL